MSQHEGPAYLIIGAYGGLGKTLTQKLSDAGASLMLSGRDEDKLADLASGLDHPYKAVDATDFDAVKELFEEADDALDGIDGVVNAAGNLMLRPAHRTSYEEYMATVHKNLTTAFATAHAAGHVMRKGGSVVLLTSAAAQIGLPNHEAIAAAKGGVIGLTRASAASYANRNLRFNCVGPGLIDSPMTKDIVENEQSLNYSIDMHGLNRVGTHEDTAPIVMWLLGPESEWVSGNVFNVDGGLASIKTPKRR